MTGQRNYWVLGIFTGLVLLVLLHNWSCSEPSAADPTTGFSDNTGYLGDQNCQSCHQQEHADWTGSHHQWAMTQASDSTVLGNFNETSFASNGVTTRFFKRDGRFMVNTQGKDGQYQDFEIAYTFGVTPLQQYLIPFPDGAFQCLNVAWDSRENKWFDLYPDRKIPAGDWLHWTGGGQTWNAMCADCHSTNLHKNFDDNTGVYQTTFTHIDVSCEACHGPGQKHVDFIQSKQYREGQAYDGSAHLYLTKNISSIEQVDQCARCHSRRAQITPFYNHQGEYMDHYVPDVLRDEIYHADGQIKDEVYVYGSFVQSKMYHHQVRCTNCHNPHSLKLKAVGNDLCAQCHDKQKYDTQAHHFHPVAAESGQCVNCHMPGQYYMVNDFRRDHSFRIPRPDLSVQFNTPNACNGCHSDQSSQWAADAVVKWYGPDLPKHFSPVLAAASTRRPESIPALQQMAVDTSYPAMARATAIWYLAQMAGPAASGTYAQSLKDEHPQVRLEAVNALQGASREDRLRLLSPLLRDQVRSVRMTAGQNLLDLPANLLEPEEQKALEQARKDYEAYLTVNNDFPSGQIMTAQYHERMGEPEAALTAYQKALNQDQLAHLARLQMATLYNGLGRNEEAVKVLEMLLQKDPNHVQAHYSMGLLLAELNRLPEAADHLGKAAQLEPGNPRYFYNWGLALQNLQKPGQAEKAYLQGLERNPASPDLLYALCILYLQQNQQAKAREIAIRLQTVAPNQPPYNEVMRYFQ